MMTYQFIEGRSEGLNSVLQYATALTEALGLSEFPAILKNLNRNQWLQSILTSVKLDEEVTSNLLHSLCL